MSIMAKTKEVFGKIRTYLSGLMTKLETAIRNNKVYFACLGVFVVSAMFSQVMMELLVFMVVWAVLAWIMWTTLTVFNVFPSDTSAVIIDYRSGERNV